MHYDIQLTNRIRKHLSLVPGLDIEEKIMFRGMTFMVNGKMCISVSRNNLMCRFDPELQQEVAGKKGYLPMIMKGKEYKGYCYVEPDGIQNLKDFKYFVNLCLEYNKVAKSSKKK